MSNLVKILSLLFKGIAGASKGYSKSAAKRTNAAPQQRATTSVTITPQHHWPAHEDYDFEAAVSGESNYQAHLQTLAGKHGKDAAAIDALAVLMPEPTNPYDKNAVCVYIGGKAVGYLPKDDAHTFLKRLTRRKLAKIAATTCDARIMGGYIMKDGSKASYGVLLNIEPFYED